MDFDWKNKGGHKQTTTTGKQMIYMKDNVQDVNNNCASVNGVATTIALNNYGWANINFLPQQTLKMNQEYYFSADIRLKSGTATKMNYLQTKKVASKTVINNPVLSTTYQRYCFKITLSEEIRTNTFETQIINGTNAILEITNIMISTDSDYTYEKYTGEQPSPSPDYPSEIETVGSNVNILENKAISQTLNGVTLTVNKDGSIMANGIATTNTTFKINNNIVPKNISNLILSGCPNNGSTNTYDLKIELYKNGVWTKALYDFGNGVNTGDLSEYTSCKISATIRKDYNANNLIFKPKLEKGSVATPYSPYGMGSVEIDVVNSNLLDFNVAQDSRVTVNEDGTLTINGTGGFVLNIDKLQLKAGITYYQKVELISGSISGSNINTTFLSFAGDGVWISSVNFSQTNLTKDTEKAAIWINASAIFNNAVIKIWANTDKSDFVKHQSQTAIMPIQQEMLEGDYVADVEHHEWGKLVLTGDEGFIQQQNANKLNYFYLNYNLIKIKGKIISNMLKSVKSGEIWNKTSYDDVVGVSDIKQTINVMLSDTTITTLQQFKEKLKELYNAGTPIIIYYELATPVNLELTEEQKSIRDTKLYTYKNITNIDVDNELASIDVEYKKDPTTEHDDLQNQIDEIKQLLSTTQTSALLLDNLQKDVESEVE